MTRHQGLFLIMIGLFLGVLGTWSRQDSSQEATPPVQVELAAAAPRGDLENSHNVFNLVLRHYLHQLRQEELTLAQASAELEVYCRTSQIVYLHNLAYVEDQPTDLLRLAANILRHFDMAATPMRLPSTQRAKLQDQFEALLSPAAHCNPLTTPVLGP